MKKYGAYIIIGTLIILLLGLLMQGNEPYTYTADSGALKKIAVVVYGDDKDRWFSLNQGIRYACSELNIEETTVTLSQTATLEHQSRIIQREIESGVDGILFVVENSKEMGTFIREISSGTPIVTLENTIVGDVPSVGANNIKMGEELARSIAKNSSHQPALVFEEKLYRNSVKTCYDSFMDESERLGVRVKAVKNQIPDQESIQFIYDSINTIKPNSVVAFDNETMETIIDAVLLLENSKINIYGVGSSDKVLHYLDNGIVEEIAFPDEFEMGYLGAYKIAEQIGVSHTVRKDQAEFIMVNQDNMYDIDVQHLIFPVV